MIMIIRPCERKTANGRCFNSVVKLQLGVEMKAQASALSCMLCELRWRAELVENRKLTEGKKGEVMVISSKEASICWGEGVSKPAEVDLGRADDTHEQEMKKFG